MVLAVAVVAAGFWLAYRSLHYPAAADETSADVGRESVALPVTLASPSPQIEPARTWHPAWSATIDRPAADGGRYVLSIASRGGVVYVLRNGVLYAKDEWSGKTRWSAGDGLQPPVEIDEGSVYAATQTGVAAFARDDGRPLWNRELGGPYGADFPAIAVDGDEILATYRSIAAVDSRTGKLLWSAKSPGTSPGRPIPFGARFALPAATDGAIIDFNLSFMDRRTGTIAWTSRSSGEIVGQRGVIVYAENTWPTEFDRYEPSLNAIDLKRGSTSQNLGYQPDLGANTIDRDPPPTDQWVVDDNLWVESDGNIYRYSLLTAAGAQQAVRVIDAKTPGIGGKYGGRPRGDQMTGYPPPPVRSHVAGPYQDSLLVDTTSALWLMRLRNDGGTTTLPVMSDSAEVRAAVFSETDAYASLADGRIVDVDLRTASVRAVAATDCGAIQQLRVDTQALLVQCIRDKEPSGEMLISLTLLR
jgi:outer membrane protein assembly factor BamB